MLAEAPSLFYIHEPFSVTDAPSRGVCRARFKYWYSYITRQNEAGYYEPIRNMIRLKYDLLGGWQTYRLRWLLRGFLPEYLKFSRQRLIGSTALIKDPMAFFSAEWLAERFDMNVVIVIRHPAAFVSSVKKLDWHHPMSHFLEQPALMRERLYPFGEQIREFASREHDLIDQAILLWKLIHHTVIRYQEVHKNWIFVRHEDISRNSVEEFRELYDRLGLEFSDKVRNVIENFSSPVNPSESNAIIGSEATLRRNSASNIWNWKSRLTHSEIQRIRSSVEDISCAFYTAEDW
jgi:hypothetical protein